MAGPIEIGVTSLQLALDCPLCFWLAERVGPPPSIFAGITAQMDSVIKGYMKQFVGSSDLPEWFPARGTLLDTKQTLRATDPATGITVVGKLDALVKTEDGRYYVVDYKTGRPPEEIPDYYQTQLDGYAYLLERNGFRPVAGGVLLYFTPQHGDLKDGLFPFKITAVQAQVASSRVLSVLARAKEILEMKTPPPRAEDCELCIWREQVEGALSE
ncbi:MAG: PD-(D/E)XK nuclease family protein [Candidatus Hodarchaeaceae archaeon]|nr:PD-(D/E)XK nuclease family protein [Candidatus Hodarchaeaceae archaeon]